MAEAKKTFNEKLMAALKEMENPKKEKEAYKYKYETLEQVLGIVKPALEKNGLALMQGVTWNDSMNAFVLTTKVISSDVERILDIRPFHICDDAQAEGSWETYMRRYALRTAFGLTGEDDDGAATLKGSQKGGSYAKSGGSNDALKGAKVTEMISEKQEKMIHAKVKSLADIRGVAKEEAMKCILDKVGAESVEKMTKSQASDAITQLVVWEGNAKDKQDMQTEMYEEDVMF